MLLVGYTEAILCKPSAPRQLLNSPRLLTTFAVVIAVGLLPRLVDPLVNSMQVRPVLFFLANLGLYVTIVTWFGRRYPTALANQRVGRRTLVSTLVVAALVTLVLALLCLLPAWLQYTTLQGLPRTLLVELTPQILGQLNAFWGNYCGWHPLPSLTLSLLSALLMAPLFEEAMHSLMLASLLARFRPALSIIVAACLYIPPHLLLRSVNWNGLYLVFALFLATGLARYWSGHWLAAVFVHAWANLLILAGPLSQAVFIYLHYTPR